MNGLDGSLVSDAVCPVPRPHLGTPCSLPSAVYCTYELNCPFQVAVLETRSLWLHPRLESSRTRAWTSEYF
jgi:hypothetical protein